MEHPPEEVLLRFALVAASPEENRQVVRHLLSRCPSCAATLRKIRREPPLDPPPGPEAYDQAFDRVAAFLRELIRKTDPPRRPKPAEEEDEEDLRQGSRTTGSAVRSTYVFG